MKIAPLALVATLIGTASFAEDGFVFAGEINAEYNVDSEVMTSLVTPEVSYSMGYATLIASTDLALYNDGLVVSDTLQTLPALDFRAEYTLRHNVELYGEVSYDLDAEARGDVVVGASFAF